MSSYIKELTQISNVHDMIMFHKYPAETHFVQTADGYILELNRITRNGGRPVLFVHGLQGSAMTWVMMGPSASLPYMLYNQGYDIWLANVRGCVFSRQHIKYDPNLDPIYWQFSWHEIGMYDLPAIIDYVLYKTDAKQLTYFGHSQGGTAFFVMASILPEYNNKINLMHALTPAVYLSHMRTSYRIMGEKLFQSTGFPFLGELNMPAGRLCLISSVVLSTCLNVIDEMLGPNIENINPEMIPVLFSHFPSGSGIRQVAHFFQVYKTGVFAPFDEGFWLNNTNHPSPYPLRNVKAPVALYYCKNDFLIGVEDMQRLARELPNVVENYLVPLEKWNHMDPIIGSDAKIILYDKIIQVQKKLIDL
ncbi:lipase 3-like [Teleopsis dalmanni]|uniref:lipase 3-like n=1 Tax=Teleopsis dalmanni TaxID=139649 RepID=UPI0018CEEBFC|nr:lipase 3-like [Teleopsis dalmanni]